MRNADAVIALFPESAAQIEAVTGRKVQCFGCPANACVPREEVSRTRSLFDCGLRHVLFIGGPAYAMGLVTLAKAADSLAAEGFDITVDVVGMTEEEALVVCPGSDFSAVSFYGYLDKGVESDSELYYRLVASARLLVNTSAGWPGASSVIEALYYGVPVAITDNVEMRTLLGNGPAVTYLPSEDVSSVQAEVLRVLTLDDEEWLALSVVASSLAEPYSWENYSERLEGVIRSVARIEQPGPFRRG